MQKQKCINQTLIKYFPSASSWQKYVQRIIKCFTLLYWLVKNLWFTIAFIASGKISTPRSLWESFYFSSNLLLEPEPLKYYNSSWSVRDRRKKVTWVISRLEFSASLVMLYFLLSTSVALRQRKWKSLVHIYSNQLN